MTCLALLLTAATLNAAEIPPGYTLQYYDDCGVKGRQPHVPADTCYTLPGLSEDTDLRTLTVAFGAPHLEALYTELDPAVPWVLVVTYASEQNNPRRQRLLAGDVVLHDDLDLPQGKAERVVVSIPPEAFQEGELRLRFELISGPNAVVSAIELWARLPAREALQLTAAGGLRGGIMGTVLDFAWGGVEGAVVSVADQNGSSLVSEETDASGAFAFDGTAWADMPRDQGLVVSALHGNAHAEARLNMADLYFEPRRIRPVPHHVATDGPQTVPLDGLWSFAPEAPEAFPAVDASDWDLVKVPGQWLQQGYELAKGQTTALMREVKVPAEWQEQRVFLRFDAVHGAARYWMNGALLGETDLLFLPVEFEVTKSLRYGEQNTIAITLTSDSEAERLAHASTYAHHDLSGIPRSARLMVRPRALIEELKVSTEMCNDYRDGTLRVKVRVDRGGVKEPLSVFAMLHGLRNDRQWHAELPLEGAGRGELTIDVDHVRPWTAESPNCYTLDLSLRQGGSETPESHRQVVGFRDLAVKDGRLLLNGQPLRLAGVNRHEINTLSGRADTVHFAKRDVRLFRAANVNYIRASHYPPTQEFLEACDRLGMYVEVEAPFCWTRTMSSYEHNPEHARLFVEPAVAMAAYQGNHPSVILWSLGNESGGGGDLPRNYQTAQDWLREADPTRPTCFNNELAHDGQRCDVAVLHYQSPPFPNAPQIQEDPRPILLDEYWHTAVYQPTEIAADPGRHLEWGFGQRGPEGEWNRLMDTPRVLGGAVWAGIDEVFQLPDGSETGYGPWGIIDVWRREKPEYYLLKRVYSPVQVLADVVPFEEGQDSVEVPILNRYSFTGLDDLRFAASSLPGGGSVKVVCPPGESTVLHLGVPPDARRGDLVELRFDHPSGHTVTTAGVWLGERAIRRVPEREAPGAPRWRATDKRVWVQCDDAEFTIDLETGIMTHGPLAALPTLHVTRKEQGFIGNITSPYEEYPDPTTRKIGSIEAQEGDGYLVVTVKDRYEHFEGSVVWRVDARGWGDAAFNYTYTGPAFPVREAGLRFHLPRVCQTLSWDRDGSWNVYPEGHLGRLQGVAQAFRNAAFEEPGVRPPGRWEDGATQQGTRDFRATRYNIRSASLTGGKHAGVTVLADGDAHIRAAMHEGGAWLHAKLKDPPAMAPGAQLSGRFTIVLGQYRPPAINPRKAGADDIY